MISQSLAQLLQLRVNKEMPRVLSNLKDLTAHLTFLCAIGEGKSIDARELNRCLGEGMRNAMFLHHEVERLAEFMASIRRRHLGDSYGQFAANYHGMSRQIAREFERMETAALRLRTIASDRMNEPGRWGDASLASPSKLLDLIFQLIELWGLLRVRDKLKTSGADS